MYFTREPLIETVINAREGYKLVIRNSKGENQEEYFVDAIEVVSFGPALFFRSLERPKSFLVPVSDYEVMEVRETRMILKAAPLERGVKIGGGRDAQIRSTKEETAQELAPEDEEEVGEAEPLPAEMEGKLEKRKERKRHRKRRGRGEEKEEAETSKHTEPVDDIAASYEDGEEKVSSEPNMHFSSLIPPPSTLISETLAMYKGSDNFKGAFTDDEIKESVPRTEKFLDESDDGLFPPPFHQDE